MRFYGRWVDEQGPSKEIRNFVVRFHLEDDTVEVGEVHDVNSGRYKAPLFLKRCRLPKVNLRLLDLVRLSNGRIMYLDKAASKMRREARSGAE